MVWGGCEEVLLEEPLISEVDREELVAAWEGTWVDENRDSTTIIRITEEQIGRVYLVQWAKGQFETAEFELHFAAGPDYRYVSFIVPEDWEGWYEKLAGYFLFTWHQNEEGKLVLAPARIEPFKAAVQEGRLQGKEEEWEDIPFKYLRLNETSETLLAFLKEIPHEEYFNYDEPMTLFPKTGQ